MKIKSNKENEYKVTNLSNCPISLGISPVRLLSERYLCSSYFISKYENKKQMKKMNTILASFLIVQFHLEFHQSGCYQRETCVQVILLANMKIKSNEENDTSFPSFLIVQFHLEFHQSGC